MRITTTKKFDKKLTKQPPKIKQAFKQRVVLFKENIDNPILRVHKLSGVLKDSWSFNVTGDIRVVFDWVDTDMVTLVNIGSHSELYS
jgi:addiction module RelE/StbE family toxin